MPRNLFFPKEVLGHMSNEPKTDDYRVTKNTSRGLVIALAVLIVAILAVLILCLVLALNKTSSSKVLSKEELSKNVGTIDVSDKANVAVALRAWGFTDFDSRKFTSVERIFAENYYKDLPENTVLAKNTAETFLEKYYDTTDFTNRETYTDSLISSYVLSVGDRYAAYRTASEYEVYDGDMEGTYVGIGVTVEYSYADGTMPVPVVNPGGPAEAAGIAPGDMIYKADGELISELGYTGTINKIRGAEGTEVTITVLREEKELSFTMIRRAFVEETVTYELDENQIAYLRVTQFKANTGEQFIAAMNELTEAGVRGIVFDMRGNPGGYLSAVTAALDVLAPQGEIIVSFDGYAAPVISSSDSQLTVPAVVLCNGYTASAGELFTAALRDYAKLEEHPLDVTVIGTTTYKKGVMQTSYSFSDGSALTLTISYYTPPSGVNYDGVGITPDIVVENTDDGVDRQLERAYSTLSQKLGITE